jgi:cell fate (sporulation/competence/biofilm development) regulator YlbF (YheA/YmcA/DUF963 family)
MMLEERARELGRIIGQSSEYQALKRANESMNEDKEVVAVLQEMERLRRQAEEMIGRGEQPTAEMEQQLDEMLGKVQQNSVYQRVISAQENFDKTMVRVNQWILEGIRKGAASPIITLG